MATPKKQKNGTWKITVYSHRDDDGKKHSKTFTGRTRSECIAKANHFEMYEKGQEKTDMTVKEACESYIDIYAPVLSVSTIRGYDSISRTIGSIEDIHLEDLTEKRLQQWISEMIKEGLNPKTIKNKSAFVLKAIKTQDKNINYSLTLPRVEKKPFHTPSDEDIHKLLNYAKFRDLDLYNAILLFAFGPLRRSEALALTKSDINGNEITINKAVLLDKDGNYVIGKTKTIESTRVISMPDFVIKSLLKAPGFTIIDCTAPALYHKFKKACDECGLEDIHIHSLRHYAASIMHYLKIADKAVMARGGWSTDKVMKDIYIGAISSEQKKADKIAFDHFEKVAKNS